MKLDKFKFEQLEVDESINFAGTEDSDEDRYAFYAGCNKPEQWSCSHYSPPGSSCNRPSQSLTASCC